jgi:hypothetical protein
VSKYDKASEKFSAAVRTLVVRDLPLKERLVGALESIKRLDVEDLPEDMREDFQRLKESDPERMSDPRQIYQYACDTVDLSSKIDMLHYQSIWDKTNPN